MHVPFFLSVCITVVTVYTRKLIHFHEIDKLKKKTKTKPYSSMWGNGDSQMHTLYIITGLRNKETYRFSM